MRGSDTRNLGGVGPVFLRENMATSWSSLAKNIRFST